MKVILSVLLLLGAFVTIDAQSYTLTLAPEEEECVVIRTPSDKRVVVSGSFDFLDDGVDPDEYSFQISNFYTGKSLWNADTDDSEGLFELKDIKEGSKLNFCFENHLEDDDDEDFSLDVGFSVRISNPPRGLEDGEIGPDAERALSLAQKATAIHQDWEVMMDHMMFVRSREANHQSMHDAILGRLSRWTYIEAFLVIGMATGQVLYWKKFFETRRYL